MKIDAKTQQIVNDWWREHGDKMHKPLWEPFDYPRLTPANIISGCVKFVAHSLEYGIPFATEVRLNTGVRPDIVAPTHVLPIIEVLWSESKQDFLDKKSLTSTHSLQKRWILHDAKDEYVEKMISEVRI